MSEITIELESEQKMKASTVLITKTANAIAKSAATTTAVIIKHCKFS